MAKATLGCVSALSFGQIDGGAAAALIAGADGVTGGRRAMLNGLGTFHTPCPIRLPVRRSARDRFTRSRIDAGSCRGSAQRAHGGRVTCFSDAGKTAASIGCGRTGQDGAPTARSTCECSTGKASAAGGKTRARCNDTASGKASSDRGASTKLRSAGHQAVCDTRTEDAKAQQ